MARYDQCDSTCTTDCGHCKGQGPPELPAVMVDRAAARLWAFDGNTSPWPPNDQEDLRRAAAAERGET